MTASCDVGAFYAGLVSHGLIIPTGIKGGYGRGAAFEDILRGFNDLVSRVAAPDGAEELMFPPILPRALIEQVGYMDNFPQLAGSVHSFFGDDAQARELSARVHAGERWDDLLAITEVMLTPAACYPVYPTFSGLLPHGGRLVTVMNWVYRHEPSDEPTRLQAFRMREFIRVGKPDVVVAWRDAWLLRFNWHQDHFSSKFGIRNADESVAHTACLGFGLERVTLALLKTHGFEPQTWPEDVRAQLWP
ncbi:MAG: hypothetical protein B7Y54_10235 [Polaromonas sp. 35-63-240]|nr:MAG: hypothetical protein B7Y54_10235 [Polaromonas sp. 35-63-240]